MFSAFFIVNNIEMNSSKKYKLLINFSSLKNCKNAKNKVKNNIKTAKIRYKTIKKTNIYVKVCKMAKYSVDLFPVVLRK